MEKENIYKGTKVFDIGEEVIHKTTGFKMQVMAYGRADNDMRPNSFDYDKLICKFWHPSKEIFMSEEFRAIELKKG